MSAVGPADAILMSAQSRVRKSLFNAGLDWTKPWPLVPPREKAMFYETVRAVYIRNVRFIMVLQVRNEVPYMRRFDDDWATAKIASGYASHLRSVARENHELKADPRYDYLKLNSAKRRPGARRGVRPGLSKRKNQAGTDNVEVQDPGPSGAGPSSLSNVNTTADEELMDERGMFGSTDPSEDEGGSDLDDNPDF